MAHKTGWVFLVIAALILMAGCDIIPTDFNFGVDANIDVETTSDLGEDTLERIDEVNETIANGFEVGPETRDIIEELNETIANGVKAGFDDDTLARVDELLRVVEDGLEIGLDSETLDSINGMVDTIDNMPGQWETTATNVVETLESSAGTAAAKMADEVKGLLNEARINYQQMTAVTGIEFRCNVDYLGSKAGASVQEFIGKSIVGKIKRIISGEGETDESVPTPWVCQVIPDKIILSAAGDKLVYEEGVVTLTGYNYVDANSPQAYIQDENGQQVPGYQLPVYRSSPYQLQLNLQNLDLKNVPARSRLVIAWPNVAETSGIAILLPANEAPVAAFSANPTSGAAPLTVQFTDASFGNPVQWEWDFGDGASSLEQNPGHQFIKGGSFHVRLKAINARGSTEVTQIISVDVPLKADFNFEVESKDIPLVVKFFDHSDGSPTTWHWDFGDGKSSEEQNPIHIYEQANPNGYVVSLTVTNPTGSQTKTAPDRIYALTPVTADFTTNYTTGKPPLEVKFTDKSKGEVSGRLWEFGNGDTSTDKSPTYKYNESGVYNASLTVRRADGAKNTKTIVITVQNKKLLQMLPSARKMLFSFPEKSVFFTSFQLNTRYQQLDTGISFDKYVCVVAGMEIINGFINPNSLGDPFSAYTFHQFSSQYNRNTWWLTAGFATDSTQFPVDVMCLNRTLENKVFTYREDFRNIDSGRPVKTGLAKSSYFSCSIAGATALGPATMPFITDFPRLKSTIQPVVLQAFMDGSGEEWTINVDMALNEEEKWNVNVLCFKGGDYMLGENPIIKVGDIGFPGGADHKKGLNISAQDFVCAVGGWSADHGDQGFMVPDFPHVDPVRIRTNTENGTWWIIADHASFYRDENWMVKYWCVRTPYAVRGVPPS